MTSNSRKISTGCAFVEVNYGYVYEWKWLNENIGGGLKFQIDVTMFYLDNVSNQTIQELYYYH